MNTKTSIFFIFLISLSVYVNGQLTVDAGNDTTVCMCENKIRLGGNPTANGGTEPYTYKWESMPRNYSDYRIRTSYFLDDSTSANPLIDCYPFINDTVTLVLTVTDVDFNSKTDSVKIIVSSIGLVTMVYMNYTINQGDSVQLEPINITFGIAPFSYQWTPVTGLSNPNVRNPYAKPDTTTQYNCIVTDALGCSALDINDVKIISTGISDLNNFKNSSIVFPNPITLDSRIEFVNPSNEKLHIKIVNTKGQVILKDWSNSDFYNIGKKINQTGIYMYTINSDKELLSIGKFVKQ